MSNKILNTMNLDISIRTVVLQMFCLALLFLLVKSSDDYWVYAVLLVISGYGKTILNYVYLLQKRKLTVINLQELNPRRHLKPIFILFAMYVSIDLYTVLDTTMLGILKNDRSVGLYTSAIKIPRLTNSLIAAVGTVLVPRLAYYYDVERNKFKKLIDKAVQIVFMLSIPAATAMFFWQTKLLFYYAV